ncbi:hydrogenase formation protein HypD [Francisella philomiragia]|uniref:hydrogenase formation protein HypD n=1 Tax=Francisella philomiragia TaxID=28110 RepID=UPI0001AF7B40|nr:hydrogenase formation protein HypD [Francisella philomiragia]AJI74186.1 hydrogenase expression/formation protein HypD [Francisella philomiragia subsp. philomiragia ATCC 25015]EET20612.1 hydrogenase expression/formation protein [Francisella philomiragia subsp. philomiragia ATCC 25015]MBK2092687.1 hydrogenase formation protein HypD [Francisella philomiragia]MBK2237652.1 hydrogenase formation protein HypD [Francisella philomiragia]MBK2256921.1 hydrogenase formation protein HypD [Francisella ph
MDYIQEFRAPKVAKSLLQQIAKEVDPNRQYNLMEFCGGHTHALHRYGIPSLLPENVKMIHGPGCPVCVLPIKRVDQAIFLASQKDVIFCSYADMIRVPGSHQDSLIKAKARGADVRMIYSVEDALKLAEENPNKKIIFFAIGFETTTPPTAVAIQLAIAKKLDNFLIFCNHVLTPVAMQAILSEDVKIDGFLGPSHVSVIIGSNAYDKVTKEYEKPMVVAGFEPLDVLQSILMVIKMINAGKIGVENQYTRAVVPNGNQLAQDLITQYLTIRDTFEWRGLGYIPNSALEIKDEYAKFDAEIYYQIPEVQGLEHKQCACPDILRGLKEPKDCKLFGVVCTPEQPMGACMVSSEGACAAHYQYGD